MNIVEKFFATESKEKFLLQLDLLHNIFDEFALMYSLLDEFQKFR